MVKARFKYSIQKIVIFFFLTLVLTSGQNAWGDGEATTCRFDLFARLQAPIKSFFASPEERKAAHEEKMEKWLAAQTPATEPPAIPAGWFADSESKEPITLSFPKGVTLETATVPGLFYANAKKNPDQFVMADDIRGAKTRRDIVAGVYTFLPTIKSVKGKHVGILLPASGTSTVVTLATQVAGKVPTMFNPTVGARDFRASMETAGVEKIVTSRAYIKGIEAKFPDIAQFKDNFIFLEDLAQSPLFKARFLYAKARAALPPETWLVFQTAKIDPVSNVIFTSGSSGVPKAVEVLHKNQIVNAMDIIQRYQFIKGDSLLGFLPHFHSFGLTGTVVMPLVSDEMKVVYAPNALAMKEVAKLNERYKTTVTIGTNTFLKFLAAMGKPDQLKSLRLALAGAEPFNPETGAALRSKIGDHFMVRRAYGMSELGPGVMAEDLSEPDPAPNCVGKLLDHAEAAIVQIGENGVATEVAPGEQGRLLVGGPSVMKGYIGKKMEIVQFNGKSYFDTGDIFSMNPTSGNYYIHGRASMDFWKIGGEMITRSKLQDVLETQLPGDGKTNIQFIVLPDKSGDKVKNVLFTTRKDLTQKMVDDAVTRGQLSNIYGISRIVVLDEFPTMGTGKMDMKTLTKMANGEQVAAAPPPAAPETPVN